MPPRLKPAQSPLRDLRQSVLRGIKAPWGRRASSGRTHGTAIWLYWAHSSDLSRMWLS